MRAKKVFEKFTEESDPIQDLGIGLSSRINNDHLADMSLFFSEDICPGCNPLEEYPWLANFKKDKPILFNYLVNLEKQDDLYFSQFFGYEELKWNHKLMKREILKCINTVRDSRKNPYKYYYTIEVSAGEGMIVVFSNIEFPNVKDDL